MLLSIANNIALSGSACLPPTRFNSNCNIGNLHRCLVCPPCSLPVRTKNGARVHRCGGTRYNSSIVLEESITEDTEEEEEEEDDDGNSNDSDPRPKSLRARNLLSFSNDITGLAATLARQSSRKQRKRTRMLADLEDYNNLFSRRLSRGGMEAGSEGQGQGHGHGGTPIGSRATSRTNSCRTVSDLDVEPAADVERPPPPPSEDMSVDDEKDFGSSAAHGGVVTGDDSNEYSCRHGGGSGAGSDGGVTDRDDGDDVSDEYGGTDEDDVVYRV